MKTLRFAAVLALTLGLAAAATAANLVTNGSFASNLGGWKIYPAQVVTWQPLDVLDRASSGSLSFTVDEQPGHGEYISQCIPVAPGTAYDAGARIMLPGGQARAKASLGVAFYTAGDCSGSYLPGMQSNWVSTQSNGAFVPVAARHFVTDPTMHSAWVILNLVNVDAGRVTAYFDEVIFAPSGGCVPDEKTLCLESGRFEVTATYAAPGADDSDASVMQLTADSGYMWFFGADNVEITVKVLDACGVNQKHWVFAAGMTNVRVDLAVRDTATGSIRHYVNPLNTPFEAILDTGAFPCP